MDFYKTFTKLSINLFFIITSYMLAGALFYYTGLTDSMPILYNTWGLKEIAVFAITYLLCGILGAILFSRFV